MKKALGWLAGLSTAALFLGGLGFVMVVSMVVAMMASVFGGVLGGVLGDDEEGDDESQCTVSPGQGTPVTADQEEYVRTMIGVAQALDVPEDGQIIAVMTMLQESSIQNYANGGENNFNYDIGAGTGESTDWWLDTAMLSLDMPHDQVGNDADSVGLFQQRASAGWADAPGFTATDDPDAAISRLMDPAWGAEAFFGGPDAASTPQGLLDVDGWEDMSLGQAAQTVQGSAFPDAYDKWEDEARSMVQDNQDADEVDLVGGGDGNPEESGDSGNGGGGGGGGTECGDGNREPIEAEGTVGAVIEYGEQQFGVDYSWGGGELDGPSEGFDDGAGIEGFDCSSLMRYMIYQGADITLPRVAADQYTHTSGEEIEYDDVEQGDLMFWSDDGTASGIYHVAMYVGNGEMIEAPQTGDVVKQADARENNFYAATRINFEDSDD